MLEFEELLRDLFRHTDIDVLSCIVPFKTNTTVQAASPIFGDSVVLFNRVHEVFGMFTADVLDAKVIHDECEHDWTKLMSP